MAYVAHSMLFLATVYKWQTNQPEGWNRVRDDTAGTQYLLNTSRLDGIRQTSIADRCSLYYFDNPYDYRDNSHYMVVGLALTDIRGTGIVQMMDTNPTHTHMDLSIYPDMDITQTPVTTVITINHFSFAVAVPNCATNSYVYYVDEAWRFKRCRVNQTLAQLLALIA